MKGFYHKLYGHGGHLGHIKFEYYGNTVEPALRDHAGEAVKVVSYDRWSLKPGFQNLGKIRKIVSGRENTLQFRFVS